MPFFSQDDPVPGIYVAPPMTSSFKADCLEKLPLVQQIAKAYHSIRVPRNTERCSWCPKGKGRKNTTYWMYGLLYTMCTKSLEYLNKNPATAELVCDNAKIFLLLFSGNDHIRKYCKELAAVEKDRPPYSIIGVSMLKCVISNKTGSLKSTRILPRRSICIPACEQLLKAFLAVSTALFGSDITEHILDIFKDENNDFRRTSDNITLNPYLGDLVEAGLVGLRPLALTKRCVPWGYNRERTIYRVHFSVHWIPKLGGETNPNERAFYPPDELCIDHILGAGLEFPKYKDRLCEIDADTKQPILDGHECFQEHHSLESAERCFILLAFRWSVNMALSLAGGLDINDIDVMSEYEEIYEGESSE